VFHPADVPTNEASCLTPRHAFIRHPSHGAGEPKIEGAFGRASALQARRRPPVDPVGGTRLEPNGAP
jgi:hypothetical protein